MLLFLSGLLISAETGELAHVTNNDGCQETAVLTVAVMAAGPALSVSMPRVRNGCGRHL